MAEEVKSLLRYFEVVRDPRKSQGIRHPLENLLAISIVGFICDCNDFADVVIFGKANEEWFSSFLTMKHGIPSEDTFERVFSVLDVKAWQKAFREWVRAAGLGSEEANEELDEIIAMDGKTARGSHNRAENLAALHTVNAWSSDGGVCLGQMQVSEKTNEITVLPELIQSINPVGAVVTTDALGTQKDVAWMIRECKADYFLALKGNHEHLFEDAKWLFNHADEIAWENTPVSYYKTEERSHGRDEVRECWSISDLTLLKTEIKAWKDLTSIARVRATITKNGKTSTEDRFYISSLPDNAQRALYASRTHWGIENSVHWVLDVIFNEDNSRARTKKLQANLVTLRQIALNILKLDPSKGSLKGKRKRAGWDKHYLLSLLKFC